MTEEVKLAAKVYQYAVFNERLGNLKASQIRELLIPIFGEEATKEATDHVLNFYGITVIKNTNLPSDAIKIIKAL
jgi:hypothetical protein